MNECRLQLQQALYCKKNAPPPQVCDRCESDRKRPSLHDIQAAANPNKAENMHNLLFKDEDAERLLLSCHTTQP